MIGQFCRFFCVSQDDPRFNLINLAYDADGVELPDEPETDWSRDSFYPFLEDGFYTRSTSISIDRWISGIEKVAAVPLFWFLLKTTSMRLCLIRRKTYLLTESSALVWSLQESCSTYEKVATAKKQEEDVVIANIDADKYKDLGEKVWWLRLSHVEPKEEQRWRRL
ncbi:hypothetical protein ZIOFF_074376 (mitochondrion) [Zingiber officinale]|uniref:Uncharacterized protein n=1 Tax=Zingiber officinale TaxID=94328 RepID=A0A8J5BUK7_ZINOF|nr:hypothetical protein ZIOFF_074376 [Zingiber officinale]